MAKKSIAKKIAEKQKRDAAPVEDQQGASEEQQILLHPIAMAIMENLDSKETKADYEFVQAEIDDIRNLIADLFGNDVEVHLLCHNLLNMAAVLDEDFKSPVASKQLFDLIEEDVILDELKAISERYLAGGTETRETGKQELAKFTGRDLEKKAPVEGEEKPEGAISVDDLDFPKRL